MVSKRVWQVNLYLIIFFVLVFLAFGSFGYASAGEGTHDSTFEWWEEGYLICSNCHQIVSSLTGNPNIWTGHIGVASTTYPSGMDCDSCHNYTGSKLVKALIDSAIAGLVTDCSACHDTAEHTWDPNTDHRTLYTGTPSNCNSCHTPSRSPVDIEPNLQDLHVQKITTSYPSGMDCNSCHNYTGSKLSGSNITNAINLGVNGNTACNGCHDIGSNVHESFHNTTYLSSQLSVECSTCHPMQSSTTTPANTANLQTWHIGRATTTYPAGMNCASCHNYTGSKLTKATIDAAIAANNTNCDSCHTSTMHVLDPNTDHRTTFLGDTVCGVCHTSARSPAQDSQPNLQDIHMTKATTTYPSGMNCNSCHSYSGSKLSASRINTAINSGQSGNTACDGCHTAPSNIHESQHNTTYLSGQLSVECSSCHPMQSSTTTPANTANLRSWHIGRATTTYPAGMNCASCHNYTGSKLTKATIDAAIAANNTNCNGCHGSTMHNLDPNTDHRTSYLSGTLTVDCSTCHSSARSPAQDSQSNLQDIHITKNTTSYPSGMNCNSCHSYSGSKLSASSISTAINSGQSGNTYCNGCHSSTIHALDPNTDHRTSFLGDSSCSNCHTSARSPAKDSRSSLQDLHVGKATTSYPSGMNCNSCHSYSGSKLSASKINVAINSGQSGNTACDACHLVSSNVHEILHNTTYLVGQLPVECSSCHPMQSSTTTPANTANLWKWHIGRATTSYPGGMNCQSCHSYSGSKLNASQISEAIASNKTNCDACHTLHDNKESSHDTVYLSNKEVKCEACHLMKSSATNNANLQKWHIDRKTTSYPAGMVCNSCHNYEGNKLSKASVDSAIEEGNTKCSACHSSTIHSFDPNIKHRTSFLGEPDDCITCHEASRSKKDSKYNLQDFHVGKKTTAYPKGMVCNSCHDYAGSKLSKSDIKKAIADGGYGGTPNTKCSACHKTVAAGGHEKLHNTKYDSNAWPVLSPDCTNCHEMASSTEGNKGNPNLWEWHIGRATTTYKNGMVCQSCHNYSGNKLDKSKINTAISEGNTDCKACHGLSNESHEVKHDTNYIDDQPISCDLCHQMVSSTTLNPNLWTWHLNRKTTTYSGGMDCDSCHEYSGSKLKKDDVNKAIADGNTSCDACHEPTMHNFDPNESHRTDFRGNPKKCIDCHKPSRTKRDSTHNLQDLHLGKKTTSYPGGMECASCHSYSGNKLSKSMIKRAIADGGYAGATSTRCTACHIKVGPHSCVDCHASKKGRSLAPHGWDKVKAPVIKTSIKADDTGSASGNDTSPLVKVVLGLSAMIVLAGPTAFLIKILIGLFH